VRKKVRPLGHNKLINQKIIMTPETVVTGAATAPATATATPAPAPAAPAAAATAVQPVQGGKLFSKLRKNRKGQPAPTPAAPQPKA
jgi:hypothetical protein